MPPSRRMSTSLATPRSLARVLTQVAMSAAPWNRRASMVQQVHLPPVSTSSHRRANSARERDPRHGARARPGNQDANDNNSLASYPTLVGEEFDDALLEAFADVLNAPEDHRGELGVAEVQ